MRDYRVVFGPGAVAETARELERLGASRPVIVTGTTLGTSDVLDDVLHVLGDLETAVFAGAGAHGLVSAVNALADLMKVHRADALVSLGGGSAVDVAKGATMVSTGRPLETFRRRSATGSGERPMDAYYTAEALPCAPIVAVTTTLSGAEFTGQAGLTLEGSDGETRKDQYYHRGSAPTMIVLDPRVTRRTPLNLWRKSGIKCLDHDVERIYSLHGHPFTESLSIGSARILLERLGTEADQPDSPVRTALLIASWMAQFSTGNVNVGLSHALGHQVGALAEIGHGDTSAILLPHVMRFNAVEAEGPLTRLAQQVGCVTAEGYGDVEGLIQRIEALIARLELPTRLRDTRLTRDLLPVIAERTLTDTGITGNPRRVTASGEVLELLERAW
ncbi:iron-containing alcohol dehydrogenase [Capillimicrobium parvum]|uniref:iron-containing alcohol dehydrogenase n=1 Tax=Capillimicrobium parvum TaxID=2884022 RepID=UPI00216B0EA9|nr:iron-containing alcohol dehydrogenase [Capillimicrobium parvum]